jgi:adenylate cyclase
MDRQEHRIERRLAAIFAAAVAGYSRLMEQDEIGTLHSLTDHRQILDRLIAEHGGRIANTAGDSVLAEFPSAVDAVQCAITVQETITQRNQDTPEDCCLQFRIGVHVGDVMVQDGDLLGDGVNIAARLESLAEPGGVCLSEAAYGYVRKTLPLSFTDLGLQTVKNIGEPIRAYALTTTMPNPTQIAVAKTLPLPNKPSIAVLPFANMSADPEQEYLTDGMVEEITAALSRICSLFVIARNSSLSYKGTTRDVRQIAQELGVRYVLVGSVRKSGPRVRVTAELVDGSDGGHIWADRYDSHVEDIFDLQDRLTEAIIGAILPNIRATEIERARRKRPDSLDAYDCVMRAMPTVWSNDPETAKQALELLGRATALDPDYALAKSMASWCHAQQVMYLRSPDPQRDRERALALTEEAARLDSNDPLVLTTLSAAYTLSGRLDRASTLIEKALQLDPNSAWAWQRSGWIHVYREQPELALDHFKHGLRISPFDPINFNSYIGMGVAHFTAVRYEEAIEWLKKGLQERPSAVWAYRLLTPAYAQAGRMEDARRSATLLLQSFPEFTISRHFQNIISHSEHMNRIIEGLRKAGVPE